MSKTKADLENENAELRTQLAAAAAPPVTEELVELVARTIHQVHRVSTDSDGGHKLMPYEDLDEDAKQPIREGAHAVLATLTPYRWIGAPSDDGGYGKGHSDAAHKAARMVVRATGRHTQVVDEIRAMGDDPNAPVL